MNDIFRFVLKYLGRSHGLGLAVFDFSFIMGLKFMYYVLIHVYIFIWRYCFAIVLS